MTNSAICSWHLLGNDCYNRGSNNRVLSVWCSQLFSNLCFRDYKWWLHHHSGNWWSSHHVVRMKCSDCWEFCSVQYWYEQSAGTPFNVRCQYPDSKWNDKLEGSFKPYQMDRVPSCVNKLGRNKFCFVLFCFFFLGGGRGTFLLFQQGCFIPGCIPHICTSQYL